jgi:hypothetical protein
LRRLEGHARGVEIPFLQYAAGAGAESREKESLGQRVAWMRRWPQMEIRHPVFGAEIFEVEPDRRGLAPRHRGDVDRRQLAGECLDHDVSHFERIACVGRLVPVFDDDAVDRLARAIQRERWVQFLERMQVVDEHAHLPTVLARQLAREAPAHADVAEIVDYRAKDIAGDRCGCGDGLFGRRRGGGHSGVGSQSGTGGVIGFCKGLAVGRCNQVQPLACAALLRHSRQQGSTARGML